MPALDPNANKVESALPHNSEALVDNLSTNQSREGKYSEEWPKRSEVAAGAPKDLKSKPNIDIAPAVDLESIKVAATQAEKRIKESLATRPIAADEALKEQLTRLLNQSGLSERHPADMNAMAIPEESDN